MGGNPSIGRVRLKRVPTGCEATNHEKSQSAFTPLCLIRTISQGNLRRFKVSNILLGGVTRARTGGKQREPFKTDYNDANLSNTCA